MTSRHDHLTKRFVSILHCLTTAEIHDIEYKIFFKMIKILWIVSRKTSHIIRSKEGLSPFGASALGR
jgi:hypothetical protein